MAIKIIERDEIDRNSFKVVRTKSGLPAIWESGGSCRNTGAAKIIANRDGLPKRPIYIRRKGERANREHALFVLKKKDLVFYATRSRDQIEVHVWSYLGEDENGHIFKNLASYYGEVSEFLFNKELEKPVRVAAAKACCYHCRSSHYWNENGINHGVIRIGPLEYIDVFQPSE